VDSDHSPDEQQLLFVIRSTNIIETKIKRLIASFTKTPSDRLDFVVSYLLSNSIISFGAKVKLVLFIAKNLSVKIDRQALHTLLSRRNAFAHQDHLESIKITDIDGYPDVSFVVDSISGAGVLGTVTVSQAFGEFVAAYAQVEKDLDSLFGAMDG
jgi:hypothetical protein